MSKMLLQSKRKCIEEVSGPSYIVLANDPLKIEKPELHYYYRNFLDSPEIWLSLSRESKDVRPTFASITVLFTLLKNVPHRRTRQNAVFLALISLLKDKNFYEDPYSLEMILTIATPVYESRKWDNNVEILFVALYGVIAKKNHNHSTALAIVRDIADTTNYYENSVDILLYNIATMQIEGLFPDQSLIDELKKTSFAQILYNRSN